MSDNFNEFKQELFSIRKSIQEISIGKLNRSAKIYLYDGQIINIKGRDQVKYLALTFSVR